MIERRRNCRSLLYNVWLAVALLTTATLRVTTDAFSVGRTTTRRTSTRRITTQLSASNANELMPLQPGSTVALTTPFDPQTGHVDEASLRSLLQMHVNAGTDGLCVLGTTGEASTLSMDERGRVLEICVDQVKGKVPLLVGTGTVNIDAVRAMTLQAMDKGCDAALVVTPYYVKPPQRCLIQHMIDVAQYGFPVVMYNVPGRTGVDMTDTSLAIAASSHEGIVGVKDATGNVTRVATLREAMMKEGNADNKLLLYSGDDATSMDFVLSGGDGCISVTANVAPKAMHEMVMAALAGNKELATTLNTPLQLLHDDLFCESNPMPVKYALSRVLASCSSHCRKPLESMDPALEPLVDKALRQAGLI